MVQVTEDRADSLAGTLYTSLTDDLPTIPIPDFSSPDFVYEEDNDSALYADIPDVSIGTLTDVNLEGEGVFDKMMAAADLHIQREFKGQRIVGADYAKVYTAIITTMMGNAVQFSLGAQTAHWQAVTAQMQAREAEISVVTARVNLETAKINAATATYQMEQTKAQVGLTKMEIANANVQHLLIQAQINEQNFKVNQLLPITQDQQQYNLDTILVDQHKLLQEQIESERAKTLNTRQDGTMVMGLIGKQKDVQDQQISSFVAADQYKMAKMYFDGYVSQLSVLSETPPAPTQLNQTNINQILTDARANVGL